MIQSPLKYKIGSTKWNQKQNNILPASFWHINILEVNCTLNSVHWLMGLSWLEYSQIPFCHPKSKLLPTKIPPQGEHNAFPLKPDLFWPFMHLGQTNYFITVWREFVYVFCMIFQTWHYKLSHNACLFYSKCFQNISKTWSHIKFIVCVCGCVLSDLSNWKSNSVLSTVSSLFLLIWLLLVFSDIEGIVETKLK